MLLSLTFVAYRNRMSKWVAELLSDVEEEKVLAAHLVENEADQKEHALLELEHVRDFDWEWIPIVV